MKEELLNQLYLTSEDLTKILPIGITRARQYVNEIQGEMKEKGYFIPEGRKKVALTKLVRKKFGI